MGFGGHRSVRQGVSAPGQLTRNVARGPWEVWEAIPGAHSDPHGLWPRWMTVGTSETRAALRLQSWWVEKGQAWARPGKSDNRVT